MEKTFAVLRKQSEALKSGMICNKYIFNIKYYLKIIANRTPFNCVLPFSTGLMERKTRFLLLSQSYGHKNKVYCKILYSYFSYGFRLCH